MDFIVFFKFIDSVQEQDKYFVNLKHLQEWIKWIKCVGSDFEYINACTADEHEEVVFSSVDEIMEAR